ncbi:Clp protease N-terminal domain-containing protein [Georgenia sp. Z1491]|uniref:Clp protease N-terminal domain-containing protein n=1 Tax=Georgenia sp. Z1491 TaxID=3416707 RepID=UPI003CED644B
MKVNRFTSEARAAVVHAQELARRAGAPQIEVVHVARAALTTDGEAARALGAGGVDVDGARAGLAARLSGPGLDGEALAGLGIDVDAVRSATDATFGEGAFARADLIARNRGRRGNHLPFTAAARKVLQLALREAVRLGDKAIDERHILLAVLRSGGPVAETLAQATDRPSVRRALEAGSRVA